MRFPSSNTRDTRENNWEIGQECKCGDTLSGLILISRILSQGKESEGSELVRERKLLCNFERERIPIN